MYKGLNPILTGTRFGPKALKMRTIKAGSLNPILTGTRFGLFNLCHNNTSYLVSILFLLVLGSVKTDYSEIKDITPEVSILFLLVLGSVPTFVMFNFGTIPSLNPILTGTRFGLRTVENTELGYRRSQSYSYWYSVRSNQHHEHSRTNFTSLNPILTGTRFGRTGLRQTNRPKIVSILFLLVLGSVLTREGFIWAKNKSQSYSYWYSVRSDGKQISVPVKLDVSILFLLVLGSVLFPTMLTTFLTKLSQSYSYWYSVRSP